MKTPYKKKCEDYLRILNGRLNGESKLLSDGQLNPCKEFKDLVASRQEDLGVEPDQENLLHILARFSKKMKNSDEGTKKVFNEMADFLVRHSGVSEHSGRDKKGRTPFDLALKVGNSDLASKFLSKIESILEKNISREDGDTRLGYIKSLSLLSIFNKDKLDERIYFEKKLHRYGIYEKLLSFLKKLQNREDLQNVFTPDEYHKSLGAQIKLVVDRLESFAKPAIVDSQSSTPSHLNSSPISERSPSSSPKGGRSPSLSPASDGVKSSSSGSGWDPFYPGAIPPYPGR